jgi:hypothetical protein
MSLPRRVSSPGRFSAFAKPSRSWSLPLSRPLSLVSRLLSSIARHSHGGRPRPRPWLWRPGPGHRRRGHPDLPQFHQMVPRQPHRRRLRPPRHHPRKQSNHSFLPSFLPSYLAILACFKSPTLLLQQLNCNCSFFSSFQNWFYSG